MEDANLCLAFSRFCHLFHWKSAPLSAPILITFSGTSRWLPRAATVGRFLSGRLRVDSAFSENFSCKEELLWERLGMKKLNGKIGDKEAKREEVQAGDDQGRPWPSKFNMRAANDILLCHHNMLTWNKWGKMKHTGDQYSAASNCSTVGGCMIRVVCFSLGSKNMMQKVVSVGLEK